ncbi:pol protein [Gossypium australe]|uniref:Pol protein n=1 Tax=Gossypium australe TaxID=47621 RepID=A0A5B6WZW9_9ROSI|nr:pol protein [Gossypium australe]
MVGIFKIIRDFFNVAIDRQKSYTDLKRNDIEFAIGGQAFLKVSPWKKVLRFEKNGELSLRFIGPIDPIAYKLALPPELEKIHNVFRVSMLRRYKSDPSHPDLTYYEEPVKNLALKVKELRNK